MTTPHLDPSPPDPRDAPGGIDTDEVRHWIRIASEVLGIGIPVALVGIAIVTGESLESIIWIGIMGVVLGLIVMYGISPRSFSLSHRSVDGAVAADPQRPRPG